MEPQNQENSGLEEICKLASKRTIPKWSFYLCGKCYGQDYVSTIIQKGGICVATTFTETAPGTYEASTDISRMAACPHYLTEQNGKKR